MDYNFRKYDLTVEEAESIIQNAEITIAKVTQGQKARKVSYGSVSLVAIVNLVKRRNIEYVVEYAIRVAEHIGCSTLSCLDYEPKDTSGIVFYDEDKLADAVAFYNHLIEELNR